ncbi:MAG: stage II sporulation protein P [Lachnospiraceae bacterium]|nr:stage II sporulation protein P [Lachnospiraceae bacterium]
MSGRKWYGIRFLQSGLLFIMAGILFFLYDIPWSWIRIQCPILLYGYEDGVHPGSVINRSVMEHIPLYVYAGCDSNAVIAVESRLSAEDVLLAEGRDEEQELFNIKMAEENSAAREKEGQEEKTENDVAETETDEPADAAPGAVVSALNLEQYKDMDRLISDFYVVDKSTYITAEELNVDKLLNFDLTIEKSKEKPQILIYHTHSQEGYKDSVAGDKTTTVVGAGEYLARILEEEYGFGVLHHTGEYDVENRDYAYANAVPDLERILSENPSVEVVIDLHRDGVADGTHLVTEIDGKQMAQFMFFNGMSRLNSVGEIDYLRNDNRDGNLAFSFQLQVKCKQYYPGLARNIYLKGYRYNMQYKARSLLVELGAQTNTVEEVYNTVPYLAHVLAMVLSGDGGLAVPEETDVEER